MLVHCKLTPILVHPCCLQAFAALRGAPTAYSGRIDAAQTEAKLAGPAISLVALVQVGAWGQSSGYTERTAEQAGVECMMG